MRISNWSRLIKLRAKNLLKEDNYSKDFLATAVAAIDPDLFVDIVLAYQARKREHEEWEALEARRRAFDERRMYVWRLTHDHS
jgi:hypothetical protein